MNRKRIVPPTDMPLKFKYQEKNYQWYPGLKREKKRKMIAIYQQFKNQIRTSDIPAKKLIAVQKARVQGWVCMQWDKQAGPTTVGQFPDDLEVGIPVLMQVYQNHSASGDPFISMESNGVTITSYFSGKDTNLFVIVLSDPGDAPDRYSNALTKYCNFLLRKGEDFTLTQTELEDFYNLLQRI